MKRFIVFAILFFLIISGYFIIGGAEKKKENKIKVAEVTHSVFYAPLYVAKELGYFKDEGIDLDIILSSGADKVTAAVLSGDVQIGFCGSEATMYLYNQGEKDYLVNFAGLTKKDGSFIISRKKYDDFKISDLKGKRILGGRDGGMPAMTLLYTLKANGIDANVDTSVDFASMSGAFISGNGDFVTLFEPTASKLVNEGYGYIVASVGEIGGNVPYTTFNARKSFIESNPKVIKGFVNAINKGLNYVHSHDSMEVAKIIVNDFPDNSLDELSLIVKKYMDIDSWFETSVIGKDDFNHIMDIVKSAGKLNKNVSYDKLVDNSFYRKK